jgi:hypothetical protein
VDRQRDAGDLESPPDRVVDAHADDPLQGPLSGDRGVSPSSGSSRSTRTRSTSTPSPFPACWAIF